MVGSPDKCKQLYQTDTTRRWGAEGGGAPILNPIIYPFFLFFACDRTIKGSDDGREPKVSKCPAQSPKGSDNSSGTSGASGDELDGTDEAAAAPAATENQAAVERWQPYTSQPVDDRMLG